MLLKNLYTEIKKLISHYKKTYVALPKITIITHSHGGNVALYLAQIKEKNPGFSIAKLIILACPVQEETKHLIADPIFGRVYSFYSTRDTSQVIDPQGYTPLHPDNKGKNCRLFSERRFPPHKKLSQAKIKWFGVGITHAEFIFTKFIKQIPKMLNIMDKHQKEHLYLYQTNLESKIKHDYIIYDLLWNKMHQRGTLCSTP